MEELRQYLAEGSEILEKAAETLGEDDPVFEKILTMMRCVRGCCSDVESFVKRGERMETF